MSTMYEWLRTPFPERLQGSYFTLQELLAWLDLSSNQCNGLGVDSLYETPRSRPLTYYPTHHPQHKTAALATNSKTAKGHYSKPSTPRHCLESEKEKRYK